MNNIPDIIKAIEYIEIHIKESVNIGDVASYVGFSKYHFARIFKDVTGMKPSDYFRGRKVTEALNYMKKEKCRIIDAAFEYGFNSPEVFTRSCLSAFGISPSQIKKSIQSNNFHGILPFDKNQLLFYNQFKDITIVEKFMPSILLKGYSYTHKEFLPTIDLSNPVLKQLVETSDTLYHLHWAQENEENYHHLIGVPVDFTNITDDDFSTYVYKKIPEENYLVFPLKKEGKELPLMNTYVYDYFLPRSEYLHNRTYSTEAIRLGGNQTITSSLLYVPIKRKRNRKEPL